ncbi:26S proteasome non-ATPase regulatory subunit [Fasciola hepatica]|uniref:26S proteasome non-ATPase regulatory subunit 2 n=1 Tax=Fasciola hepatica TaxID=6192 RepID=A0A4E0QY70_FASHE|nr:26S proteasome non-ATPase regulatory subunit [Fasciola hepatica]
MVAESVIGAKDKTAEKKKGDTAKEDELSEEDKQLQEELNMLVERLGEANVSLHKPALETMRTLIKSATTSMTSVPKPLKFMMPHYAKMKSIYDEMSESSAKHLCADIVSVLGMTVTDKPESRFDTLNYRLLGTNCEIGAWGHEYVRHLTSQVVAIWQESDFESGDSSDDVAKREQYLALVHMIIPYLMEHNAESEAIDLCIELEKLQFLEQYTSALNYQRVCLYLTSCVAYLPTPDNTEVLKCATTLYRKFDDLGNAMRCALKLNNMDTIQEIFIAASKKGSCVQRQLAYLLGKQGVVLPNDEDMADEDLTEMLWNTRLSEHFLSLGRELDIMEPKLPEDIYKTHLETVRPTLNTAALDSARANLAASYVNGLVNCGFGKEKLLQGTAKDVPWLFKQKEFCKMSTVATLGWVLLWDVDTGLSQIDKYLYSAEDYTRAGGLLGCGVVNCGVKNECDPALALLGSYVDSNRDVLSRAAIIGLGVAYAGSMKAEALAKLTPVVLDVNTARLPHACLAALSAGMIAVGSLNDDVTSTIIQSMLERPTSHWNNVFSKFMALGLALTCMGRQEEVEVILASLEAVSEPMKSMAHMMCDFCAYAGSGNVLKVQKLLHILSEKYEEKDKGSAAGGKSKEKSKDTRRAGAGRGRQRRTGASRNTNNEVSDGSSAAPIEESAEAEAEEEDTGAAAQPTPMDTDNADEGEPNEESGFDFHAHQGLAALGVAVIAMGEEVGLDMAFRMFGHLLRFGELPIKRAVPLALALCYVSNPQLKVLDTLSKFSHDSDSELSYNSILALGLVGAGTNNARLAAMLRQLAVYHSRDPYNLFVVRLAQGLTHLGKGTLTLSPWHSERFLSRPVGIAGLLTLLVSCLDMRTTFMARHDYLIFYLTPAIQPRLLMSFDEDLKQLPVTVRVGQAVDVVGQAGRPKTITGFQTHTTPVLLSYGERAELATEEYMAVTQLPLEGFVILKKNPDYEESTA